MLTNKKLIAVRVFGFLAMMYKTKLFPTRDPTKMREYSTNTETWRAVDGVRTVTESRRESEELNMMIDNYVLQL